MRNTLVFLSAMHVALALGCGGGPVASVVSPVEVTGRARSRGPAMQMTSELGFIDPLATKKAFRALDAEFDRCEDDAVRRLDVLAGDLKFFVRVSASGRAKYAYLLESTVGDREVEECFVNAVEHASFPKPQGGEAEVTYKTNLKASPTRPATDWPADRVAHLALRARGCKDGSHVPYHVTMYVGPQGGSHRGGRVLSVGIAAPEADADARIPCILQAVRSGGVPTPGSWPAKVTFEL